MTDMTLIQQNEILAKFMGWKEIPEMPYVKNRYQQMQGLLWFASELKFHSSWDWLMPVVEKLESIGFALHIDEDTVYLHFPGNEMEMIDFTKERFGSKIATVYKAVCEAVEFI